jgi:hypothetical protein
MFKLKHHSAPSPPPLPPPRLAAPHRLKRMRPKNVSISRSRSAFATRAGVATSPAGICCSADSLRAEPGKRAEQERG